MEEKKSQLKGRYIKAILIDGEHHYSKKTGLVLSETEVHLILQTSSGEEYLLKSQILRMEVQSEKL